MTSFVQGYPTTTGADRTEIGVTVRDTRKTPTPTTRPLVTAAPGRLTHEQRPGDETSPTPRGKPEGVAGAKAWVKLIDAGQPAPGDPNALSFLTMTTHPTLRTDFRAADGGKTAVFMPSRVHTRGKKWS